MLVKLNIKSERGSRLRSDILKFGQNNMASALGIARSQFADMLNHNMISMQLDDLIRMSKLMEKDYKTYLLDHEVDENRETWKRKLCGYRNDR